MRRLFVISLLVLVALAAVAHGERRDDEEFSGDVQTGRRVFVDRGCIRCHSVLGSGGGAAPDLATSGKGLSFFEILGRLWSHSPRMVKAVEEEGSAWPRLSDAEMDDLLAYLYYLNYFDKPGDFGRGEKIFRGKGCISCHAVGEQGGEVGPTLDPYGEQASPIAMVAAMWNHGPNMSLKMKELSIPEPQFEGTDVADLLAYIRGVTVTSGSRREFVVPGNTSKGLELFGKAGCGGCHSVRGEGGDEEGDGSGAPDLGDVDLQLGVSELAGVMWNHGPIMWKRMKERDLKLVTFTPNEMSHLIAYLYFINYYSETGTPEKGKKVYEDKGCVSCHPEDGTTVGPGPELAKSEATERPVQFAAALWNHAPGMLKRSEDNAIVWPDISGAEMRDLYAYLAQQNAPESQ